MASEVFITRRGNSLRQFNIYMGIYYMNVGTDETSGTSNYGSNFIVPYGIFGNKIFVECMGGGGGASYIANSNIAQPVAYGLAGGGSGWYNSKVIDCVPGQRFSYKIGKGGMSTMFVYGYMGNDASYLTQLNYPSTGGTTSFGTVLSANGGSKGVCMLTNTMLGGMDTNNYTILTGRFGSTYGATGGSGGSGGGAIFWNMNNAIGGRGYQFGGGAGGKGGDGGTWGGGGAGLYNGGNGGIYGGGGGGGTTGGRGGCSNPANGALATTRYGRNAGQNGTSLYGNTNIVMDYTAIGYNSDSKSIETVNYYFGMSSTATYYNAVCGNPGNKMYGGGGYGSYTNINTNSNYISKFTSCLNIGGGAGYLANAYGIGLTGGAGKCYELNYDIKLLGSIYKQINLAFASGGGGISSFSGTSYYYTLYNNTNTTFFNNKPAFTRTYTNGLFYAGDLEHRIEYPFVVSDTDSSAYLWSSRLTGYAEYMTLVYNMVNNAYIALGGVGGSNLGGNGGSIARYDINKTSNIKYMYNTSTLNYFMIVNAGQGGALRIFYYAKEN